MASEEGSNQEERKRKVQESLAGNMDVDFASSKRHCLEAGSSGSFLQLTRQPSLEVSQQVDWEQLHRQGDIEDEQVKRVDGESLRRGGQPFSRLRRVGSAPGKSWLESLPEDQGGTPGERNCVSKKDKPGASLVRLLTAEKERPGSMTSNRSYESNASVGSKRAIDEVEGSATGREVSGMGVSGVTQEGRMTSAVLLSPGGKHRRIEEEVSSSSEDEEGRGMSDQENETSALDQLSCQPGSTLLETKVAVSIASTAVVSSVESPAAPFEGVGRRQVLFPPLGGGMKRSGSRADLTEEKQPASSSGCRLSLFERLTRGVPPVVVREVSSGASVRSDGSPGSQSAQREEQRRKELESLPSSVRQNLFLSRTESERSGLGTSVRGVLNQRDVDRMLKQGPQGQGFKAKPAAPLVVGGAVAATPSLAAKFVLPDGRTWEKAKSESMVPGPTLTDETMPGVETHQSVMQSVSVTSVQGRKHATVEDEFEAYFAQMGISM